MKATKIIFASILCATSLLYAIGTKQVIIIAPSDETTLAVKTQLSPADSLLDAGITSSNEKKSGRWEILFDGKNTDQWKSINADSFPSHAWKIEDGTLSVDNHAKDGDIITREVYADFDLLFDFKLTDGANSGIKYFVDYIKDNTSGKMLYNGPEYQVIDDYNHPYLKDKQHPDATTAALYLIYAPKNKKLFPAGEWNSGRIVAKGNHLEHWLNGIKVVSCERGSKDFRDRMAITKFNSYDHYGELPAGHIMLTDHDGDKVYFRNIKIKRLK
ncbi:MAG: hypothetical protein JWR61_381 [Ferruginibacter sp.]|uniref:3-keto-disaccharide hydrolase n=1 Tax=Ferruginibacter sp. TaxID=1940288 RepID=UPI00265A0960|nr:DUF1080 domain-containing protein [Ferruginibacter sp.]MDB5275426.1 hypothetical protein [Ferruginibacter sp.]